MTMADWVAFERYQAERRRLEASQPTSDFDHAVERAKQLDATRPKKLSPRTRRQKP